MDVVDVGHESGTEGMQVAVDEDESWEARALWLWTELTSSQALPIQFWVVQAAGLATLACVTWGFGIVWARHMDARVAWIVDRYIDAVELFARPLSRASFWAANRVHHAWCCMIPESLRKTMLRWEAVHRFACVISLVLMACHHGHTALIAAASKGVHRIELPIIALGAVQSRWGCTHARLQDGILPKRLAALPMEADGLFTSSILGQDRRLGARRWEEAKRAARELGSQKKKAECSAKSKDWYGNETRAAACICSVVDGPGAWQIGRALLWPVRSESLESHEHAARDDALEVENFLYYARLLRAIVVRRLPYRTNQRL